MNGRALQAPPLLGLRFCAQVLGGMVERNPRLVSNRNWEQACSGVVGLMKDIESLNGFADVRDVLVTVDFLQHADVEDPNQLKMAGVL